MKTKSHVSLFAFALALPVCLLLGGITSVQAKEELWSKPATWPDKKVPAAGDKVEIPSGKDVVLDVTTPALGGITINGKLSFSDKADLELSTEWIMVHGELQIGTEAKPYTHKATITLTDNVKGEQMMGMGDRGIMLSGGTLNLHG
ncbi:MAG TPA: G8 domain-containing protein, partial [Candidatus Acidoferrum sp.]|nr:G8 domain-containing protein [Candidatus Acidoferrum sp.]